MSTTTDADAETAARTRRARFEPLDAERIAPGMFEVSNLRTGGDHVVDIREEACDCDDYRYRMGPADGRVSVGGTLTLETRFNGRRYLAPEHPANEREYWEVLNE